MCAQTWRRVCTGEVQVDSGQLLPSSECSIAHPDQHPVYTASTALLVIKLVKRPSLSGVCISSPTTARTMHRIDQAPFSLATLLEITMRLNQPDVTP